MGLTQAAFKLLPLHWVLERVRYFCVPFKSGVSVSYSPPCLPYASPLAFKAGILGTCLPSVGPPGWGVWCGAWIPNSLGRTSAIVIMLPFVGYLPKDVCLDSHVTAPPTSLVVVPSLYL